MPVCGKLDAQDSRVLVQVYGLLCPQPDPELPGKSLQLTDGEPVSPRLRARLKHVFVGNPERLGKCDQAAVPGVALRVSNHHHRACA